MNRPRIFSSRRKLFLLFCRTFETGAVFYLLATLGRLNNKWMTRFHLFVTQNYLVYERENFYYNFLEMENSKVRNMLENNWTQTYESSFNFSAES